jgi:hypothetical protein
MSAIKTTVNDASVEDFLNTTADQAKRQDAFTLLKLFKESTGESPKMWGSSIVGFGQYHYKYERSRQEGDWMLTGFSPRKANLSIYIMDGFKNYSDELAKLGKHKISTGSCLYINRLADIDLKVLADLVKKSYQSMKAQHS